MEISPEDDLSSLERARQRLYEPRKITLYRPELPEDEEMGVPHGWEDEEEHATEQTQETPRPRRHVKLALKFFAAAVIFFIISLGAAFSIFFAGGNSVSVDKIRLEIQGPTTLTGGDAVPIQIIVTNRNSVPIYDATVEMTFPNGTRKADNLNIPYTRYVENIGTIPSGGTVTRSVKVVLFGGEGQALSLPTVLSYSSSGSNAVFVKKENYKLTISTTPLSVVAEAPAEIVSGQPFSVVLTVRSNATVTLNNVVLNVVPPFGFTPISATIPLTNSTFLIGTMKPGTTKEITLTGSIVGQDREQRVFHFIVGTAKTARDQSLAVTYMSLDAQTTIAAPFISTTISLGGDTSSNLTLAPGTVHSITLTYQNTLLTNVANAKVSVTLTGTAIDYGSIETSNGFYDSTTHTIIFSPDTDPSLSLLTPGAKGIGAFTFATLPAGGSNKGSPTVTLSTSVSGTRVGQTNVPETTAVSTTKTYKVATTVQLLTQSLHASGPLTNTGPVPLRPGQPTTYTIQWRVRNPGSAIAGGVARVSLPTYVSFTNQTSGKGSFAYDSAARLVTWTIGDIPQGGTVEGYFQVSVTPSTSQSGNMPEITREVSFSGYDRFAGVPVTATGNPVSTDTRGDPGYLPGSGIVQ